MVPGHTKFKCDGSFGLIKKLYRKTTVNCVNDIVEVVKKSSTAGLNKAQRYDNGKGFQVEGAIFAKGSKRLGLLGMRERAEQMSGNFILRSNSGQGTEIVVELKQANTANGSNENQPA